MDKINIHNIYSGNNDFKPLTVNALCDTKRNLEKEKINLNVERLINLQTERKNKILTYYDEIYQKCLKKIMLANNLNKTSITYSVPKIIYNFNYNCKDCVTYI